MANVQMTFTAPEELLLTRAVWMSNVPIEIISYKKVYSHVFNSCHYNL